MNIKIDTPHTTGVTTPTVSPSKEKEQILKLKIEKKDLEDDIKRLKITAFKIKSDMVFTNAITVKPANSNDLNTNDSQQDQQQQQDEENKEKYYQEVTVSAATAARKRKSKSSFPSLSTSQISYNHYPNFPRMALKEQKQASDNNIDGNHEINDEGIINNDSHDSDKDGKRGDEYCQIDDIYNINHSNSKKKNTHRQSTRYYNKDGLIVESSTDELLQQKLQKEIEEEKEKQRKIHFDALCQAKNDAISTIQLFNKNLLLFKMKFKHGIFCQLWEGESIINAPMIIKLDPRNHEIIKFEQTPETLLFGYFSTLDVHSLKLCDIYEVLAGADIADDLYATTTTHTSNSMSTSETNHHHHHRSCFLSIVSKGDHDVVSRRLALELPNMQERNILISGIRTLISELHMVHMNAIADTLLMQSNDNNNNHKINHQQHNNNNHQNNNNVNSSQMRLETYNKNHRPVSVAAAVTASSSSSSVILNKQRSKSIENALLLKSRNMSLTSSAENEKGISHQSGNDTINADDIVNNNNNNSSDNNMKKNTDTVVVHHNNASGYNIRSSITSALSDADYDNDHHLHHHLHHHSSSSHVRSSSSGTIINKDEDDDVLYNLTHSTSHNRTLAIDVTTDIRQQQQQQQQEEEEEEEVCEWRDSEDYTNIRPSASSSSAAINSSTINPSSPSPLPVTPKSSSSSSSSSSSQNPQSLQLPPQTPSPQRLQMRPKLTQSKSLPASPSKQNNNGSSNGSSNVNDGFNDSETFFKFDGKAYTPVSHHRTLITTATNSTAAAADGGGGDGIILSSTSFTGSAAELLNKPYQYNRNQSYNNSFYSNNSSNNRSFNSKSSSMATVINGSTNYDAANKSAALNSARSHNQQSNHHHSHLHNNYNHYDNAYNDRIDLTGYRPSHDESAPAPPAAAVVGHTGERVSISGDGGKAVSDSPFNGQLSEELIARVQRDKLLLQMLTLSNDLYERDDQINDIKSHEYLLLDNLNYIERMYQQEKNVSLALTHRLYEALGEKEEIKEQLKVVTEELNAMKRAAETAVAITNCSSSNSTSATPTKGEKWDGRVDVTEIVKDTN